MLLPRLAASVPEDKVLIICKAGRPFDTGDVHCPRGQFRLHFNVSQRLLSLTTFRFLELQSLIKASTKLTFPSLSLLVVLKTTLLSKLFIFIFF